MVYHTMNAEDPPEVMDPCPKYIGAPQKSMVHAIIAILLLLIRYNN